MTDMQMQDPEAYLPERFMPDTPEAAAVPEHGWVPFGEGTRACIGLRCAPCWPSRPNLMCCKVQTRVEPSM